jgi:hypothetical protein
MLLSFTQNHFLLLIILVQSITIDMLNLSGKEYDKANEMLLVFNKANGNVI